MKSSLRQAGIKEKHHRSATLELSEQRDVSLLRLHSLLDEPAPGLELPARTGQVQGIDPAVLCLRPREWLFISQGEPTDALMERVCGLMDPALNRIHDCSSGLAVFRLSGRGAPWLLGKLSGLDFQAGGEAKPRCASTRMAHTSTVVHFLNPAPELRFDLIFDRSFARYLWELLIASAPHADELADAFGDAA